jgi:hypothetical protein
MVGENMTTKEYLMQISRMDRMIKNKLSEIAQLRELSLNITSVQSGDRVQTTPNFDKIGTSYAKLDEMERNLDKMIDEYIEKKNEIISEIDSMGNETYYDILFARYVEKKTFEKIASETHYSFRNTTRLHGKALLEFEKKYGYKYLHVS